MLQFRATNPRVLENQKKFDELHARYTEGTIAALAEMRDALDEAGSRVHLTNINVPKEIEEQEKLIEEARSLKAEAVKSQNFELAASYRDREKELSVRLEEMKVEWEARLKEWRELQARWNQFGCFVPLYRTHGPGCQNLP